MAGFVARPLAAIPRRSIFIVAPMLLATGLCLHALGSKSLWLDEAYSVALARLQWGPMWRVIVDDQANMGLYYILLHLWLWVFGASEFAVRMLSAVMAVAATAAIQHLGQSLFGFRHGVLAALLLAVNAFHVRYAQEARAYSLVLLLAIVASLLFVRALRKGSLWNWAWYVIVGTVAVYTHFFAVLVVASHVAASLASAERRGAAVQSIAAAAAIALLVSPLLAFALTTSHLGSLQKPSLRTLIGFAEELTGSGGRLLLLLYALLTALALVYAIRSRPRLPLQSIEPPETFLLVWLLLPVIVTVAISVALKPVFQSRYLIVVLPPLALLAARGLLAIRPRWLSAVFLIIVLALATRGLVAWYTGYPKEAWAPATAHVLGQSSADDAIVFQAPFVRIPFEYYVLLLRSQTTAPEPLFPAAPWGRLDLLTPEFAQDAIRWLERRPPAHRRLWVVSSHGERLATPWLSGSRRYCLVQEQTFVGVRLMLYEAGPCGHSVS